MFVIVVSTEGADVLLHEGRNVWTSDIAEEGYLHIDWLRKWSEDPSTTYTLCQVTTMPQEGP